MSHSRMVQFMSGRLLNDGVCRTLRTLTFGVAGPQVIGEPCAFAVANDSKVIHAAGDTVAVE